MNDLFNEACLIQLETSAWSGAKKLPESALTKIGDSIDWLGGRKYLVDPEVLNPPKAIIAMARKLLNKRSLPFPLTGFSLVRKTIIDDIEAELEELKKTFDEAVDVIAINYDLAKDRGREVLEPMGLYNDFDYPRDIRTKYGFAWRYVTISTPDNISILSKEVYDREVQKAQEMIKNARELAIETLHLELRELTQHMVDRLDYTDDGKGKKFKDSLVSNFDEFFEFFQHRNLFDNERLNSIVEKAKEAIKGVTPNTLRDVTQVRNDVRSKMEQVRTIIDQNLESIPRRRIRLDQAA
jgi:hypothetical protein